MIEVNNLTKRYVVNVRESSSMFASFRSLFVRKTHTVTALDSIDWQVGEGEVHALIGRNGSGKSTLVKILSGILYPTEGTVVVNHSIPWKNRTAYVRNIGVVFGQKSQLSWELPAIDTYELHKSLYDIDKSLFAENLKYLVRSFEAEEIVTRPVRNLSLGERMKCEIICSLLHNPCVLFLDEPTIGLDLLSKDQVRSAIRKINRDLGTTILLTSHDISDVTSLCDRISLIDKGKFLYNGSIDQLLENHAGYKVVSIELMHPLEHCNINGFDITRTGDYSFKVEIENDNILFQKKLSELLHNLEVKDLSIESVKLEHIVRSYYHKRSIAAAAIEQANTI